MSKKSKVELAEKKEINDEDGAFEIIELAIDDIKVLTKAFHVINAVCEELSVDSAQEEAKSDNIHGIPEHLMH